MVKLDIFKLKYGLKSEFCNKCKGRCYALENNISQELCHILLKEKAKNETHKK